MPESESVIRLEGISQVYVSEREASLVIEDLSLEIQKESSSVWLDRADAVKRHCCRSSPGCSHPPEERLRLKENSLAAPQHRLVICFNKTICFHGGPFWIMH